MTLVTRYAQRLIPILVLLAVSLLFLTSALAQSGHWRIRNRLQLTYEFDDNIREAAADTADRIQDSSLRLLFHSQASKTGTDLRLKFSYQGGLQTYFANTIENKLINEVGASFAYSLEPFVIGARAFGRLKLYLNDTFDYATGHATGFLRLPPWSGFVSEVSFTREGLDYQNFSNFDYQANELRLAVTRSLASKLTGRVEVAAAQIDYEIPQIICLPDDRFRILSDSQQDDNLRLSLQVNYTRAFLLNFKYAFQYNDSNSCGYSYHKHQFVVIFGVPLPHNLWLRGYGAIQFKNYSEDIPPFFPTDLDTERDQSNFFIADLSKDLTPGLSAILRAAYYNNESIIRSRFYRKLLVTLGFDFRF